MIHRINIFLLSLFVAFAPTYIFASTLAADGWSVTKRLVQGATTFYDGTKNIVLNGKTYAATGVAKVTPVAGQVSKMIVRTGAVLAIDLAIKAILGSVDYVMDPANNRVIYKDPDSNPNASQYLWVVNSIMATAATSPQKSCELAYNYYSRPTSSNTYQTVSQDASGNWFCPSGQFGTSSRGALISLKPNPTYDPAAQKQDKYLPYDAVAAQVISDAIAEKADGKAYVSSVADTALSNDENQQIIGADVVSQQLNNSQAIPTNGTATGAITPSTTGTGDPTTQPKPSDITLNFPVFCEWAPSVCQAAQAAINFPKTFLEKFQKWDDWINRETKPYTYDETKLDTEDKRTFDFSVFNENRFNVDDQCPAPEPHTFALAGQTVSFSFDLQPVCSILEMAKPALIAASYIYAAYIVIGASRG